MLKRHAIVLSFLIYANSGYAEDADLKLHGHFIQGGLVYGQTQSNAKVLLDGEQVRVAENGVFIIGFGRDHPKQATLVVHSENGAQQTKTLSISTRDYAIQRIDGLPNKQVNPDENVMERIHFESKSIAKARSLDDDRIDFESFIWPVKGPISGVYGSQRILNGQSRQPHFGIDIVAPSGTSVVAPAAGVVTYTHDDMYFSGGTLVLDHGHNLSSSFLHLHKILVKVGDRVEQGEQIALVGATGRVTGAHLDWRMNWKKRRIDPGLLLGEMP